MKRLVATRCSHRNKNKLTTTAEYAATRPRYAPPSPTYSPSQRRACVAFVVLCGGTSVPGCSCCPPYILECQLVLQLHSQHFLLAGPSFSRLRVLPSAHPRTRPPPFSSVTPFLLASSQSLLSDTHTHSHTHTHTHVPTRATLELMNNSLRQKIEKMPAEHTAPKKMPVGCGSIWPGLAPMDRVSSSQKQPAAKPTAKDVKPGTETGGADSRQKACMCVIV